MSQDVKVTSKNLFGMISCPAFQDYQYEQLVSDEKVSPLLNSVQEQVKDKLGKSLEWIILTEEQPIGDDGIFSILFYARLVLGLDKNGKTERIKRVLKPGPYNLNVEGLPGNVSLCFVPNAFTHHSDPPKAFIDASLSRNIPVHQWENFETDHIWTPGVLYCHVMDEVLTCTTQEEAKEKILQTLDPEEIPSTGMKQIKAFKEFQKQKGPTPFDPPPFAQWGRERLEELAPHKSTVHPQGDKKCKECKEYRIWEILKNWFEQIFLKQKKMGKKKQFDGSFIEKFLRKKCLIVRGDRRTGKSQFFLSCVKDKLEHICWIKHKISRENTANISEDTWLIVLDDFAWDKHDREMMKAIMAGEYTELDGKWLSKSLRAGIPCVILCNDKDKTWYKAMKKDKDFAKECIFCNLEDFFIGQEIEENKALEYDGPMCTYDSDDEEVNVNTNAYTIIMRQDGNPSHVSWDEYQTLRKQFDKQAKEMNEVKRAFNTAQQQMKELRRGKQLYFPSKDEEEEDWNQNPRKQVKKDSPQSDNGSGNVSTISKSAGSSACKSVSRGGSREYDVPAFSIE